MLLSNVQITQIFSEKCYHRQAAESRVTLILLTVVWRIYLRFGSEKKIHKIELNGSLLHHHWPHNGDSINTTRALPSFQLPSCLAWLYQEQCKLISNRQNLRPELKVIFIFILNIFAAKRSAMLESSCLWRDFIIKLVWTVLRMSSVTPLIKLILLLYRINTTILSGQED